MLDEPVFKILAHNDTGAARGHQGGMVIPADLEDYFPDITGTINSGQPTADVPVRADLVVDGKLLATVTTRYQYQTWGATRRKERRLTANLGPLRNAASAGDILLFQRHLDDTSRMVLTLIKKGDAEFLQLQKMTNGKNWGTLTDAPRPASNRDIRSAEDQINLIANGPFSAFATDRRTITSTGLRKARDAAFRKRLLQIHDGACAVSRISIRTPSGALNVDAAHIVPVEAGGSDDPRNGLLLSKDLHWAFDKGLFHVNVGYQVVVPAAVLQTHNNAFLAGFNGRKLSLPPDTRLHPKQEALEWHRTHKAIMS